MAIVLPLAAQMELVKGRKAKRQERRDEEQFRFPAVQEMWEVSCGPTRTSNSQLPNSNRQGAILEVGNWKLEVGID
jgi:hypothetical protein